jgi:hypothetical protein
MRRNVVVEEGPAILLAIARPLGALLALALLLPALWPGDAEAHTCDQPFSTDLIAGQKTDAGNVKVCNDDATLTVTYEATFPWCLLETHLHVATIPDPPADPDANIPQNKAGNPTPDKFAYGDEQHCEGTAVFEIALDTIGGGVSPGDTVVIAAQAEVENGQSQEGAWGKGTRFVARGNWAMYFKYTVQETFPCGGETSKCMFVTSSLPRGNLGGLAGADATCNALASAADLPGAGDYLAWLSAGGVSPSSRFTRATVPYKEVDGTTIADDWNDLTSCDPSCLDAPITLNEAGGVVPVFEGVWTGTSVAGAPQGPDCSAWTLESGSGQAGIVTNSDQRWTAFGNGNCGSNTFHLYCFQQ